MKSIFYFQQKAASSKEFIEWTRELPKDICTLVIELLAKKANPAELQHELVELLGFDKMELVEFLFSNRETVVSAYRTESVSHQHITQTRQRPLMTNTANVLASDITVHTETEKKLKKMMIKEVIKHSHHFFFCDYFNIFLRRRDLRQSNRSSRPSSAPNSTRPR